MQNFVMIKHNRAKLLPVITERSTLPSEHVPQRLPAPSQPRTNATHNHSHAHITGHKRGSTSLMSNELQQVKHLRLGQKIKKLKAAHGQTATAAGSKHEKQLVGPCYYHARTAMPFGAAEDVCASAGGGGGDDAADSDDEQPDEEWKVSTALWAVAVKYCTSMHPISPARTKGSMTLLTSWCSLVWNIMHTLWLYLEDRLPAVTAIAVNCFL